ncbi:MAG: hypothetical protein MUF22_09605, partial [Chitinispirillaceae bacterium]|nr:hypothetical protein [Chitinispirillaceae bacterium]
MIDQIFSALAGAAAGGIIVSLVVAIIGSARNRTVRKQNAQSEEIISAVVDKINDADSICFMYSRGKISKDSFLDSLEEKIESINCLYKPNLHKLEAYFVKYAEKIIEGYQHLIYSETSGASTPPPEMHIASAEAPEQLAPVKTISHTPDMAVTIEEQFPEPLVDSLMQQAAEEDFQISTALELETGTEDAIVEPALTDSGLSPEPEVALKTLEPVKSENIPENAITSPDDTPVSFEPAVFEQALPASQPSPFDIEAETIIAARSPAAPKPEEE